MKMKTKLFTRDFTLVVLGQIISLFGNAVLRFALPLYLLRETGSAALFGLVTACSFLPMIALSFLGGVLADRMNKRSIMVMLDFATAALTALLVLCLGRLPIVPLFTVMLMLLYGISGTYQPTVQASIPALVLKERILSAGAVVNQIGALAGLLGPVVGGMLFGSFGILPILGISIVCFFASAVMELFICIPFERRPMEEGIGAAVKQDFRDSLSYVRVEKPMLLKMIGLTAGFNFVLSAMLIVGLPVLVVDVLNLRDELLGFTQGALALGGLCGGMAAAVLGNRLRLSGLYRVLLLCALLIGVMSLPLLLGMPGMVSYFVITAAGCGIMGLASMFTVQILAALQTETPPELLGKVIAFTMAVSMCAQPVGQAVYGLAFQTFGDGSGYILLVSGVCSALIALGSKKTFQKIGS